MKNAVFVTRYPYGVLLSVMLLVIPATAGGQSENTAQDKLNFLVQNAPQTEASTVFRAARDLMSDERWDEALRRFDIVVRQFPQSDYTDASLYWRAFILKRNSQFQDADRSLTLVIERFPSSQWLQDAKTMQVEMSAQLGRNSQAADRARNAEDDQIKIVALQSLFQANQDRAMKFVYEILQSGFTSSPKVKEGAIKLLGRYHDPSGGERATRLLMNIALEEPDLKLKRFAIYSLGRGEWSEHKFRFEGDENIVPLLQNLAMNSEANPIATAAVEALNHIANHHEDPRIRAALLQIGKLSSSRQVRQKAISRIGEMTETEGAKILPDLVELFDNNDDRELKKHIISVMSKMNDPLAQGRVIGYALTADHPDLRKRAIYVIDQRGPESSIIALADAYAAETNGDVKNQILNSFNETEHSVGLKQLMAIARSDSDLKMRMKAVNYLGRNKDPEAQLFLEQLLK